MKKSRIIAATMASIAIAGALAGCGKDEPEQEYKAEENANICVYGPPSVFYDDADDEAGNGQPSDDQSASENMAESQGD